MMKTNMHFTYGIGGQFGWNPIPSVTFDHITIETGHCSTQNNFRPQSHSLQLLDQLSVPGMHRLHNDYTVLVALEVQEGRASFSVHSNFIPLVFCYACLRAEGASREWKLAGDAVEDINRCTIRLAEIRNHFTGLRKSIPDPKGLFLAVSILPSVIADPAALEWLGDFERCLYWALWCRCHNAR